MDGGVREERLMDGGRKERRGEMDGWRSERKKGEERWMYGGVRGRKERWMEELEKERRD